MSEFQSDIKDRQYDEDGDEVDKHGFKIQHKPGGAESVHLAVKNAEYLCGLDSSLVQKILKGEFSEYSTLNSTGRQSKKIVIEYDIQQKGKDDT